MTIYIESLEIIAIIGILESERVSPQRVIVDIKIDYSYKNNKFINYAEVISMVENMIIKEKYKLLEDALISIQKQIIKKYSKINELHIKIYKPDIIDNATVALSLEYFSYS